MATFAGASAHPTTGLRYTKVAIWLHWLIGFAVIANICLAMLTEGLPREAHRAAMGVHKALGITILALTLVRIAWGLVHKAPPLPASIPAWQRSLSRIVHFLFYALLVLLPLSGWVWMSAADRPIDFFGWFTLPSLVSPDKALAEVLHERHELLGLTMLALVAVHLAAALRHQFARSGVLARMNPF